MTILTRTAGKIQDMAWVELVVKPCALTGFHNYDCGQYANSETTTTTMPSDMHRRNYIAL